MNECMNERTNLATANSIMLEIVEKIVNLNKTRKQNEIFTETGGNRPNQWYRSECKYYMPVHSIFGIRLRAFPQDFPPQRLSPLLCYAQWSAWLFPPVSCCI